MFISSNCSYSYQYPSLLTEKNIMILSKQRIIQKNLVHFQGFPDSIYEKDLLITPEYFGQYGRILKIMLASKEDKQLEKKLNSAYITFETKEQAAYCILSVDLIKIQNHTVRAFFGTTKYCHHFLNNSHCYNEDKCMFLHYIADASDIINENTKFGYNDHIKLAKKIVEYGSFQSKFYTIKNSYKKHGMLPNIKNLYPKEEIKGLLNKVKKYNNHLRLCSNSSNNSSANNSTNNSNTNTNSNNDRTISKSSSNNEMTNNDSSYETAKNATKKNLEMNKVPEKKSRFFNINKIYNSNNSIISNLIEGLFKRRIFFNRFKDCTYLPNLKEMESNYFLKSRDNRMK